jgi:hypothetical protein
MSGGAVTVTWFGCKLIGFARISPLWPHARAQLVQTCQPCKSESACLPRFLLFGGVCFVALISSCQDLRIRRVQKRRGMVPAYSLGEA